MAKIIEWKSEKPRTKFAPCWDIPFYIDDIFDQKDLSEVKRVVLAMEKPIINSYREISNDGGTGLGPNSLTSKFSKFNIFTWEFDWVNKMRSSIIDGLKSLDDLDQHVYVQCWANVMRKGERINPHWHSSSKNCYLGAHITIASENTNTYYENPFNGSDVRKYSNVPGSLTIFPAYLTHWTDHYMGNSERVTLAMDFMLEEYITSLDNQNIKNNFCLLI